jgi:hypothetical protein
MSFQVSLVPRFRFYNRYEILTPNRGKIKKFCINRVKCLFRGFWVYRFRFYILYDNLIQNYEVRGWK